MSRQQPHLTPRLDMWPAEWIRNTPAAELSVSSRDRVVKLPSVPPPGGERVDSAAASRTSTDDVISPRTGGITDELEGSHSATLDTSQLHVKDDFFGGGDPVPETLRMTMTSSMTSSSIEFGKTGQFAMEES